MGGAAAWWSAACERKGGDGYYLESPRNGRVTWAWGGGMPDRPTAGPHCRTAAATAAAREQQAAAAARAGTARADRRADSQQSATWWWSGHAAAMSKDDYYPAVAGRTGRGQRRRSPEVSPRQGQH
jgi:hypothetical protein